MTYTRRKRRSRRFGFFLVIVVLIMLSVFYIYVRNSFADTNKTTVTVFFMRGQDLIAVKRDVSLQDSTSSIKMANRALAYLMDGPRPMEKLLGIFSEVPENIEILNVHIDGSILIINFSPDFLAYGGGSARIQAAIAQIVSTMTAINPIRRVSFLIDGSAELVIGGEGYIIDRPLGRKDINFQ